MTELISLNLENALSRIDDYRRRVTAAMLEQPKWNQDALSEYVKTEARRLGDWFLDQGISLEGFPTSPVYKDSSCVS